MMNISHNTGGPGASRRNRRQSTDSTTELQRRVSDRLSNRVEDRTTADRLSERVNAWRGLESIRRGR